SSQAPLIIYAALRLVTRSRQCDRGGHSGRGSSNTQELVMCKKVKMVCTRCGSGELLVDAFVEWNLETQTWQAREIFESSAYCAKCDDETRIGAAGRFPTRHLITDECCSPARISRNACRTDLRLSCAIRVTWTGQHVVTPHEKALIFLAFSAVAIFPPDG